MRASRTWLHVVVASALSIAQSSLLKNFNVLGARPDLAMIFIVFSSLQLGSFRAQFAGFASGLVEDFLSLSPLGFHALIKTLLSYISGIFKGKVFLDAILAPLLLVTIATFLKALLAFILSGIFISGSAARAVFDISFLVELGLNALIAPFLYGFFKLVGVYHMVRSEG